MDTQHDNMRPATLPLTDRDFIADRLRLGDDPTALSRAMERWKTDPHQAESIKVVLAEEVARRTAQAGGTADDIEKYLKTIFRETQDTRRSFEAIAHEAVRNVEIESPDRQREAALSQDHQEKNSQPKTLDRNH